MKMMDRATACQQYTQNGPLNDPMDRSRLLVEQSTVAHWEPWPQAKAVRQEIQAPNHDGLLRAHISKYHNPHTKAPGPSLR